MLDLSIVIVTYNTKALTLNCLSSIFNKKWDLDFKVFVLDNGDDDTYLEIKKKFPKVESLKSDENLGFSGGNNLLIKKVYKNSKYILLLNSDTKVLDSSLDNLVNAAETNNFDITSCELKNTNGSFQSNAGDLPTFLPVLFWLSGLDGFLSTFFSVPSFHQDNRKYYKNDRTVGWVSGSVMLIKNNVFDKVGFLDDKIFMYGEDVEFCWRANKKGFKIGWTDSAKIIHIGGASTSSPKFTQWRGEFSGLLYLYKKYFGLAGYWSLKIIMFIFLTLRIVVFSLLSKFDSAKAYAKIAISI